MASTKPIHFQGPYLRQNWSIPDSIIYSFTKNPSTAKTWQKLIHCCKYFFAKNRILVINRLSLSNNEKWNIVLNKTENKTPSLYEAVDFTNVLCKLWLTENFFMSSYYAQPSNLVLPIIPYFYRCDIKTSHICHQEITYEQFKFISSKVESIILYNCVVRNNNDENVPFEKLVKAIPKIKKIDFHDNPSYSSITSNTVKELLKIPHFSKITKVLLCEIPAKFDLETFYIYFKKNKHTKFHICFRDEAISESYKIRLEEIVDEIIAAENHDYKIPHIYFVGLPDEKLVKIDSLIRQQNKQ